MLLVALMLSCRVSRATLASFALIGGFAASCGGTTPPPAPPVPVQPVAAVQLPPAPDLRPAPEPAGLIVSGRIGKLSGLFATVRGWSNLPMPQSEQVSELLAGQPVGPLVDLDQPVDFALAINGAGTHVRALVAVSAAVKDVEAAKAALSDRYKLVPGENGALLIQGLGPRSSNEGADDGDSDGDDGDHRACELAPAFGAAPMRIVCGEDAKALSEIGPWLARTATRAASTSDLHLDMRMRPLKPTVSGLKRMFSVVAGGALGAPASLPGLRDAAMSLGNDLVDFVLDLETISLDVQLSDAGAGMAATTKFSSSTSGLTRVVTAHADGGSPTPAAFWQLPADTDAATFYRGIDANELARLRDLALKLIDAKLGEDGVKDGDRKVVLDALAKLPSSAAAVYGSGVDADAVKKARGSLAALGSAPDASQGAEARRGLAEAILGWHLLEMDEPPVRLSAAFREISAAWSRPGFLAVYRTKFKGGVAPGIRVAPVAKGSSLPKDAQHYVIELPFDSGGLAESHNGPLLAGGPGKGVAKNQKAKPKALLVHAFIAADGQRTWLAVGGDEGLVASKLSAALSAPQAGPAGDLAFFKDARTGAAGFYTLRAGAMMAEKLGVLFSDLGLPSDDPLDDIDHVPHGGKSPIVYSLTSAAGASPASVVATLQVPRGAIEDAVVGVLRHGGF